MPSALEALLATVSERAEARGHQLGPWIAAPGGDPDTTCATACLRCERVVYARIQAGIQGATGPALTEACDRLP